MASSILDLSPWAFAATVSLAAALLLVAWRSAHILLAGLQVALVGLCLWLLWIVTPSVPFGKLAEIASNPNPEVSLLTHSEGVRPTELSSVWSQTPKEP